MCGLISVVYIFGIKRHGCHCDFLFGCCRIDIDYCDEEEECYCDPGLDDVGYCEGKEEKLTRAGAISVKVLWGVACALLIATLASCCCFGHGQEEEAPQLSAIVTGYPRIEEPLMSAGVTDGIPVRNGPPRATGTPMMTTRPALVETTPN